MVDFSRLVCEIILIGLMIARYTVLCLLIMCVSSYLVMSQQVLAGVSPGDSFTYEFSASWISSDPNITPPAELYSLNETNLIRVAVKEVGGPVVVMNITRYLKNGTSVTTQTFVNILSGDGDGFGLFIAPNLNAGSVAYPYALMNESTTANAIPLKELTVKNYPFGEREVLHAIVNQTGSSEYVRISHDIYFDRKTGVMLEWYIEQIPYTTPTAKVVLTWKIKDFNVKEIASNSHQEQWQQTIIIIALVAIIVLLIYLRRRKK